MLRAMMHHVSQRQSQIAPPNCYTALKLKSQIRPDADESQLYLKESFAQSAAVEKEQDNDQDATAWAASG